MCIRDRDPEAREYLQRAGACFGTPIQRLEHMNAPAVEFYRDKGVDLAVQPLDVYKRQALDALKAEGIDCIYVQANIGDRCV